MQPLRVAWVVYGSLEQISGGYIYDRLVIEELRRLGDLVTVISLEPGATELPQLSTTDFDVVVGDELCFRELLPLFQRGSTPRRVLLIHHPPVVHKRSEEHNLLDRAELCKLLARTGAELVLHGHDHRDEVAYLDGPNGTRIPSIGAGSASYVGEDTVSARYNVYELEERRLTWVTYAYDAKTAAFREVRRQPL